MKLIQVNFLLFLFLVVLFISFGCVKNDLSNTPNCLSKAIDYINTHFGRCPALIVEYEFQNKIVYYIDPGSCSADEQFPILSSNCDTIGFLEGAAGNSIINGEDFYSKAKKLRKVWTN
ncbi:MAG: hypothetical protein ABIO44_07310 [Saprospiraceae bacterium]